MSKENLNPGAGVQPEVHSGVRLVRDDSAELSLASGEANFAELCADLESLARTEALELHVMAARRIAGDAAQTAREESRAAGGDSLPFERRRTDREPGTTLKFAARFGTGLRLAAALGLAATLALVFLSQSRTGGSRMTPGSGAQVATHSPEASGDALHSQANPGATAAGETHQQLALRAAVEQFAAVSELYDDSLNEELDALATRATSLGSWTIEGESPSDVLGGYGGGM